MPHIVVLRMSMDEVALLTRCIDATLARLDDGELLTEVGDTRRNLRHFSRLLESRAINARHGRRT